MVRILSGIFLILHGLVHFWYVVLSLDLVPYQPDMGWTGKSWFFSKVFPVTPVKTITGILFMIAGLLFVASGIAVFSEMTGLRTLLLITALFSTTTLILFWDGQMDMLVQKGFIGVVINIVIIILAIIYV